MTRYLVMAMRMPQFQDAAIAPHQAFLEALRQNGQLEHSVPPYVIFHDATLKAMLEQRPSSMDELAQISGVGARKLEAYGAEFLEVLLEHG